MTDASDQEIHTTEGKDPYPSPERGVRSSAASDDTLDPGEVDATQPHDRGFYEDGRHKGAVDDLKEQIGEDMDAWRKGRTQDRPRD